MEFVFFDMFGFKQVRRLNEILFSGTHSHDTRDRNNIDYKNLLALIYNLSLTCLIVVTKCKCI